MVIRIRPLISKSKPMRRASLVLFRAFEGTTLMDIGCSFYIILNYLFFLKNF
jgi:hypothetical protein